MACTIYATAQTQGLGTWNILNANMRLAQRWSVFAEGQIRSLRWYDHFHYYEIKGGGMHHFNENFTFALAGGYYNTYSRGGTFVEPKLSEEIRLWQQLIMKQSYGRLNFEHRYRAEQRFTNNGYRNRFRYRVGTTIPISKSSTWFLNVSNEIFFTNREPYFERNRLFVGAGHKVTPTLTVQVGYLNQFDFNLVDEIGSDFFQIMFQFNLKRSPNGGDLAPGDID